MGLQFLCNCRLFRKFTKHKHVTMEYNFSPIVEWFSELIIKGINYWELTLHVPIRSQASSWRWTYCYWIKNWTRQIAKLDHMPYWAWSHGSIRIVKGLFWKNINSRIFYYKINMIL